MKKKIFKILDLGHLLVGGILLPVSFEKLDALGQDYALRRIDRILFDLLQKFRVSKKKFDKYLLVQS